MRVSNGNLIVGMTNCDTSHKDDTLFNATDATGEYDLDLQVQLYAGTTRLAYKGLLKVLSACIKPSVDHCMQYNTPIYELLF